MLKFFQTEKGSLTVHWQQGIFWNFRNKNLDRNWDLVQIYANKLWIKCEGKIKIFLEMKCLQTCTFHASFQWKLLESTYHQNQERKIMGSRKLGTQQKRKVKRNSQDMERKASCKTGLENNWCRLAQEAEGI